MVKVIAVFCPTGRQGASVIKTLTRDPTYKVRALTRDASSTKARELASQGLEVVQVDLNDRQNIVNALKGAYGCYVTTFTDLSNPFCADIEVEQGMNIADACLEVKIQHIVYHTQINIMNVLGINARNMVAKAQVEGYMKSRGLPVTSVIMPLYYEEFFDRLRPMREGHDHYSLVIPMGHIPLDMMSVEDLGPVVHQLFNHAGQFMDKTISLSGEKTTIKEMAQMFGRQLGKSFIDKQVTVEEFRNLNQGQPWSRDWANMFDFLKRVDQTNSVTLTRKLNPNLRGLEAWIRDNRAALLQSLCH
ncbi:nmrA-like family domain-containing protein 1 [Lingula anatina]|uniref:NmrA-like family domain-containing protein 1 n=1 Tax=Lingula anatina TaxID=7574 RepID=A0A1S3KC51_LINAN|nr:nmrA-like family domain-containing protein 1 [Lingula anatina]XP_013420212.1 nmrA-like family domain-containing protein 1 [Lingula anatina]XP_013420213.1 nmrA-like family domain-containing protein 1 [Lingula anatina]|eukprot:XP_013420211.1 nmrA-like family domain-containing protein 1 [Lingula anatina]